MSFGTCDVNEHTVAIKSDQFKAMLRLAIMFELSRAGSADRELFELFVVAFELNRVMTRALRPTGVDDLAHMMS